MVPYALGQDYDLESCRKVVHVELSTHLEDHPNDLSRPS
jgi:hypothetical protein